MKQTALPAPEALKDYVKDIFLLEYTTHEKEVSTLPFYADGCPGLLFYSAPNGVYQQPKNKLMAELCLYGQTIHPMELVIAGSYRMIVFQLYPFASRMLLGINPKALNDDCCDITLLPGNNAAALLKQLQSVSDLTIQVEMIAAYVQQLIDNSLEQGTNVVPLAIHWIIANKGKITIKALRAKVHVAERTFERSFTDQVGVTPKQFARIVQFQASFNQLTEEQYSCLSDVAFDNGFADQSHFIRTFKKFTGKTPSDFRKAEDL